MATKPVGTWHLLRALYPCLIWVKLPKGLGRQTNRFCLVSFGNQSKSPTLNTHFFEESYSLFSHAQPICRLSAFIMPQVCQAFSLHKQELKKAKAEAKQGRSTESLFEGLPAPSGLP